MVISYKNNHNRRINGTVVVCRLNNINMMDKRGMVGTMG